MYFVKTLLALCLVMVPLCAQAKMEVFNIDAQRNAVEHNNRGVTVIPLLNDALCLDMAKITEALLCKTLEDIVAGTAKPVQIDSSLIEDAKKSLVRMLNHCAK